MKKHYFLPDNCSDCSLFDHCRSGGGAPTETKRGTKILPRRGTDECVENFDENGCPQEPQLGPYPKSQPITLHELPKRLTATKIKV